MRAIQYGKTVLDCGAGGELPPLALFEAHGYSGIGIDLDPKQIEKGNAYASENGYSFHIQKGVMRSLPFFDAQFSFAYSYNSIFHMPKQDIVLALQQLQRVTKPNGLLFVNFLSVDDFRCGKGKALGNHQYEQMDDELSVIHSYFQEKEADHLVKNMKILFKERRIVERWYKGEWIRQGFIDYILQK